MPKQTGRTENDLSALALLRRMSRGQLEKKTKKELVDMVLDLADAAPAQEPSASAELDKVYEALDQLTLPFALFDAKDRFLYANPAYLAINEGSTDDIHRGLAFETHMMQLVSQGKLPAASGQEDGWLAACLKQHRQAGGTREELRADGTLLEFSECKLSDGYMVQSVDNMTDQRRLDDALIASETVRDLLTIAFDEVSEGIAVFDDDDRFVRANKSWWQMHEPVAGLTTRGTSFEQHVRNAVSKGVVKLAEDEAEAWIAKRVAMHAAPGKPFEIERADGRVSLINEQRLSNRYRIVVDLDVTEHRRLQQRLEEAIEALDHAFALYDKDGKLLIFNTKYKDLVPPIDLEVKKGLSFEALFRASVEYGLHSDDYRMDPALLQQRVNAFYECEGEIETHLSDGRYIISTERKTPSGEIVALRTDITELKLREREALHAEEILLDAIESISEGFILFDADGKMVMCNSKYKNFNPLIEDILVPGVTIEEIVKKTIETKGVRINSNKANEWEATRLRQFKSGKGFQQQQLADGRWVQVVERPTKSGGVVGIRTDITDIVNAETESRRALETAEKANKAKSEFLANMSHELRTPLNAIIGFSAIISRQLYGPVGNASYQEYAGDINKSGEHLLTLIGDLLDISRIEAGELILERVQVNAIEAVRQCLRMVAGQCHDKQIKLVTEFEDELPDLYADARNLRQILINILANAIKFTDVQGTIKISASRHSPSQVSIRIADTGVGISEENLALVLEPFGQVADALTRNHDGIGLGLPIVKSIVELHGGEFRLESVVDEGTIVEVLLPIFHHETN